MTPAQHKKAERVDLAIIRWTRRLRTAKTKLAKLTKQKARYDRLRAKELEQ